MITIAECYDIQEAQHFRIALSAAGIDSFIPDEFTAQNAPWQFLGSSSGVRLQVADEDAARAQHIIQEARGKDSSGAP
jgi:Putative prokaryotic signal transducing protein